MRQNTLIADHCEPLEWDGREVSEQLVALKYSWGSQGREDGTMQEFFQQRRALLYNL